MYAHNTDSWDAFSGPRRVQVLARGYDHKPHKRWTSWVLEETPDVIVTYRPPQATVLIHEHDAWLSQAPAVCLFWPARYYNLSYVLDAEARLHGYYMEITEPVVQRPGYLEYISLNMGLFVGPDLAYNVDGEEIAAAWPPALREQAHQARQQIIQMVETRDPLFQPPTQWLDALDIFDRNTLDQIAAMLR